MIIINNYIKEFTESVINQSGLQPWEITNNLDSIITDLILKLDQNYAVEGGVAIHKSAIIENGAVIKGPLIVSENCFISANAYLRGPIYLGKSVKIGPGCEIKQSVIFDHTAIAHFNYIGNSIIGTNVNFEAGSVAANHFNERTDKEISVMHDSLIFKTNTTKFGSLVGDNCKIGANAVLSPGTLLKQNSIVRRLELIDQLGGQ